MSYKREESFVLGFWNYNDLVTGGASEIYRWKDLGLNVAMMPMGCSQQQIDEMLPEFLDELEKNGMKTVLLINDACCGYYAAHGEEAYRARFRELYNQYGKHPAVL